MKLLALETATDACSAALWIDGAILGRYRLAPREHARIILPMCEELLLEAGIELADLGGIGVGCGPGSFTGVRIACSAAQGLAYSLGLPVAPVSTLAALAQGVMEEKGADRVLAALDARMGEVYLGIFERDPDGCARAVDDEQLAKPETLRLPFEGQWHGAGDAWKRYGDDLRARLDSVLMSVEENRLPDARHVARLAAAMFRQGKAVPAEQALPVYLRERVAEKSVR
jgi:tRNA threonylcarbamoyladenosine biosynthesis protein TsaB